MTSATPRVRTAVARTAAADPYYGLGALHQMQTQDTLPDDPPFLRSPGSEGEAPRIPRRRSDYAPALALLLIVVSFGIVISLGAWIWRAFH